MRYLRFVFCAITLLVFTQAWAAFEVTPELQKELNQLTETIKEWAADPVIVNAVVAQNQKGPIADMDNTKWKSIRRSDALIKEFQSNDAGQWLKQKLDESKGLYSEAFLNASHGEKVAFVAKTSSYLHQGSAKFDQPFTKSQTWQGEPEFDESSQAHQIQLSVPVLVNHKPIGVLVIGVNLTQLAQMSK